MCCRRKSSCSLDCKPSVRSVENVVASRRRIWRKPVSVTNRVWYPGMERRRHADRDEGHVMIDHLDALTQRITTATTAELDRRRFLRSASITGGALLFAGALTSLLAACGGDDDDDDDTTDASSPTTSGSGTSATPGATAPGAGSSSTQSSGTATDGEPKRRRDLEGRHASRRHPS